MAQFQYTGDWPRGGMAVKRETLRPEQLAMSDDAEEALPPSVYEFAGYRFDPAQPTEVDDVDDPETVAMLRGMPHLFEEVGTA